MRSIDSSHSDRLSKKQKIKSTSSMYTYTDQSELNDNIESNDFPETKLSRYFEADDGTEDYCSANNLGAKYNGRISRDVTFTELLHLEQKSKTHWKKYVMFSFNAFFRALSLTDFITDLILLYKVTQITKQYNVNNSYSNDDSNNEILFVSIILFCSIISPYILSYSSGVKLFLFRRTFDDLTGFLRVLIVFYILPTGVLHGIECFVFALP